MRRIGLWVAVGLAALLGPASAAPRQSGERTALLQTKNIFHSGLRNTHSVALTFDDGPNANTPAVLDVLKANHVKATFFIVGRMAERHPEILARIAAEGHLLANHSATHAYLGRHYDDHPQMLIDQLEDVHARIAPLMKAGDKFYFRAPFGAWRPAHAAILNADPVLRDYVGPIYWDVGGDISKDDDGYVMSAADWDCWHHKWTAEACAKGYLREIRRKDGGVVLMHCIHTQSATLVAQVVPALIEEGYSFARLDQIPDYKQYETPAAPSVADAGHVRAAALAAGTVLK